MLDNSILEKLEKQVSYLQGKKDLTQIDMNNLLDKSKQMTEDIEVLNEVNKFFTDGIDTKIRKVKHQIEDIINQGLTYIYKDDSIKVSVDTVFKNNKTQFTIAIKDSKVESTNLEDSFGGGVLATVAFLFKVVVNILSKNEKFMVFDESLTFVSKHYQENLSSFIKKLCQDLDMTIVLVSHQPLLHSQADIVYEAQKEDNATNFKIMDEASI